jgi:hypothetical protein
MLICILFKFIQLFICVFFNFIDHLIINILNSLSGISLASITVKLLTFGGVILTYFFLLLVLLHCNLSFVKLAISSTTTQRRRSKLKSKINNSKTNLIIK